MRKSIINTRPYLVLLLTCPVIALIAWLRRDYSADLQLYDTWIAMKIPFLAGVLIASILLSGLAYWLTKRRAGFPQLAAMHVLGTIGIALYLVSATGMPPQAAEYIPTPMSVNRYQAWQDLTLRFAIGLVTFTAIQMILIANLVVKWVKG